MLFQIDDMICTSCAQCVDACPMRIIELNAATLPQAIAAREGLCMQCGHCAAICPVSALQLSFMPLSSMPGFLEFDLKAREMVALIRNRRSIRQYEPKPVSQETISQLLRLASYAPTGHNRQKVEWIVVSGSKEVKRVSSLVIGWLKAVRLKDAPLYNMLNGDDVITAWTQGSDPILHNAPHLIIALGPRQIDLAYIDSIIALSYIELLAPFFGLGSCWLGYLLRALQAYTPLIEAMQIPADKKAHGALMIGYAKGYYMRWPSRRPPVIKWKQ